MLEENEVIPLQDLYFKSQVWSYESEIRFAEHLNHCTETTNTDALGFKVYTKTLEKDLIRCIYIGCNASQQTKRKAIRFAQSNKIKTIFLKPHHIEYKLIKSTQISEDWDFMGDMEEERALYFDRNTW